MTPRPSPTPGHPVLATPGHVNPAGTPHNTPYMAPDVVACVLIVVLPAVGWRCCSWQAREKQVARIAREEALGALQVRLASGKRLRLADLQGTSRVVLVVGTQQQVRRLGGRACDELHGGSTV